MRNIKRKGLVGLVLLIALALCIPNASALMYTEGFEDDTAGEDPTSGQYTYTEDVAKTKIANVSADTSWGTGSETNSFLFNATDGGDDTCEFNYSVGGADNTFTFKFNLTQWHVNLTIRLEGNASRTIATLNITTLGSYMCAVAQGGHYSSDLFNQTIGIDTWYMIKFQFNYTDSKVNATLYNGSTGSMVHLAGSVWGAWGLASDGFSCFNITGKSGDKADVYFDDLESHRPYSATGMDIDGLMTSVFGIVVAMVTISLVIILFKSFGKIFNK